ncbi:MAG: hypothetical protein FJ298_05530 [Planctomycetes bacterium]|nr:hypothetical protein [Planctomycetota bacterium]
MSRAPRALVLALLLAAAGAFAWSVRERDVGLESAQPNVPAAASQDDWRERGESRRVDGESSAELESANGWPASEVGSRAGSVREVRAVLAGSSRAVAGAEILWWEATDTREEFDRWLDESLPDASLPSDARRVVADGQGRFALDADARAVHVIARAPGLFGSASFESGECSPLRVELASERELRVRVVDTEGLPLERVRIELRAQRASETIVAARTQADGIATLVRWMGSPAIRLSASEVLWLAVDELLEDAPVRAFSLREPPDEIVQFTLARSGTCEVRVLDSAGAGARAAHAVQLALFVPDLVNSGQLPPAQRLRSVTRRCEPGKPALFEHVELGRELAAFVRCEDFDFEFHVRGSSPRLPRERVVLEARAPSGGGIAGRLLRLDGTVFSNASLPLDGVPDLEAEVGLTISARLRTDAEGRFEIAFQHSTELSAGVGLDAFECDSHGRALGRVRLRIPGEAMVQRVELGDARMEPLPVFASGRVRFATGELAGGAMVMPRGREQESSWFTLDRATSSWRVRCDARGNFELRTPLRAAQLELEAAKDGYTSEPVSVTAASRDVELVLTPEATLAGRLLLHESVAPERLRVRVRESIESPALALATPLFDGTFECRGLRPGTFLLEVHERQTTREFARVEGIRVESAGATRDPRLEPLDLSGELREITLSLVDSRGIPIAHLPRVELFHGGPKAEFECGDSRVRFLRGLAPVDVLITCKSYLREFLPDVRASATIVLHEAPTLRFRLSEPDHAALRGVMPTLALEPQRAVELGDGQTQAFNGARHVDMSATMAGEYRMRVYLWRACDGSWSHAELPLLEPRRIEVVKGPTLQEFDVLCDPTELARVVSQLVDK